MQQVEDTLRRVEEERGVVERIVLVRKELAAGSQPCQHDRRSDFEAHRLGSLETVIPADHAADRHSYELPERSIHRRVVGRPDELPARLLVLALDPALEPEEIDADFKAGDLTGGHLVIHQIPTLLFRGGEGGQAAKASGLYESLFAAFGGFRGCGAARRFSGALLPFGRGCGVAFPARGRSSKSASPNCHSSGHWLNALIASENADLSTFFPAAAIASAQSVKSLQ